MQFIEDILISMDYSLFSISSIKISDIIDIMIVAYVIYRFMLWIKETRAWSLFKGILILILLKFLFLIFDFYTLTWILNAVFTTGLLVPLILFQPELRKGLEQLGKGKFIYGGIASEDIVIKEIVKAANIMSKARTGALICIENDVALGEFEKTGIPIDAVVTRQLLINIFEDKTPLHDGAVIIRSNRISAAACILPVTSEEIGKELGTRHRAAVGLSELSDASVLVVSEETGAISIAKNGKLNKELTNEELFEILTIPEKPVSKKFTLWREKK